MLLENKIVLVTGSTTGIGAAIVEECVREGAKVMVHGRDERRAQQMVAELGTGHVSYFLEDLTEAGVCDHLMDALIQQFGRIDVLINNAGLSPRDDIDSLTGDKFDWLVRLNLRAPLFLSQRAIKHFRIQQSGGTIVNIGSINAHCGQDDLLSYSITKGGLMTMTRNLGNALGSENIRVNQLNVGWTLTENESKLKQNEGFPEDWEKTIPEIFAPRGTLLRPVEIARHAVFWASDRSAPANGVVYELEQYPTIGRNLISALSLNIFK